MEYKSGDIIANGQFTGGGTQGIKIDGQGVVSINNTLNFGPNGYLNVSQPNYVACTQAQAGIIVFNTTIYKFYGCNSTAWVLLGS
jgi:hypothetical protein